MIDISPSTPFPPRNQSFVSSYEVTQCLRAHSTLCSRVCCLWCPFLDYDLSLTGNLMRASYATKLPTSRVGTSLINYLLGT